MRSLILSVGLGASLLISGTAGAQAPDASKENAMQLPVGQTSKDFQFPLYQSGQLKATLSAVSATGITLNRAETTDLKIDLYDQGRVTTTITSPKADLYVGEHKLRTKNTILIERNNLEASAQTCDFDLITKKYLLRDRVRVVLKNFDASLPSGAPTTAANSPSTPKSTVDSVPSSNPLPPSHGDLLFDSPGANASHDAPPSPNGSVTP